MPAPDPVVVDLASRLADCLRRGDANGMRELLHPEGRYRTVTGGPGVLDPDGAVAALDRAIGDTSFRVTYGDAQKVDPHCALLPGRLHHAMAGGGHVVRPRVWLCTERDGRIYRVIHSAREHDALVVYMREGIGLGLR